MKRIQRDITIIVWVCSFILTTFCIIRKYDPSFIYLCASVVYGISAISTVLYFLKIPERVKAVSVLLLVGLGTLATSIAVGGNMATYIVSFVVLAMAVIYFDPVIIASYSIIYGICCITAFIIDPKYIVGPYIVSYLGIFEIFTYVIMALCMYVGTKYGSKVMQNAKHDEVEAQETSEIIQSQSKEAHQRAILLEKNIDDSHQLVKNLANEAEIANVNVNQLQKSEADTIDTFNDITSRIHDSNQWIEENFHLIEGLKGNLNVALEHVQESKVFSGNASNSMNEILTTIENAHQCIKQSSEETQRIESILNDINEIASQTNLLAINASIEAARVNDKGSGFAIVADQIRALSVESKQASENIKRILTTLSDTLQTTDDKITIGMSAIETGIRNLNHMVSCIETIDLYSYQSQMILGQEVEAFDQIKVEFVDMVHEIEKSMNSAQDTMSDLEKVVDSIQNQGKRTVSVSEHLLEMETLSNQLTEQFN